MDQPKKVLIVDDESDHIVLIRRVMERSRQYRTETASTLSQALTLIETFHPDIILSDFRLPDGDARTIITKCTGILPVIVMTSFGNEALAVEMIKSGALDYIVKTQENFTNIGWFVERSLREWKNIEERKLRKRYGKKMNNYQK